MVTAFVGRKDSFGFRHDGTIRYEHIRVEAVSLIDTAPVSSSDATNIRTSIKQEGNEIVINGRKWCVYDSRFLLSRGVFIVCYRWISGAGDPRTKIHIVMGKSDPNNSNVHQQQSVVLVPADAPGVTVIRPMKVFGYDDAPEGHCEVLYENVRVPLSNLVLGWGKGFEV
jgi:acyl-CoA dehydrogenase